LARATSLYVCQSCGAQTRQFFGRCSSCGSWNTLVEQTATPTDNRRRRPVAAAPEAAMSAAPRRSEPIAAVGDRPLQRRGSGYGYSLMKCVARGGPINVHQPRGTQGWLGLDGATALL